jgi:hypothetical protein
MKRQLFSRLVLAAALLVAVLGVSATNLLTVHADSGMGDGRINPGDPLQSVAVYCIATNTIGLLPIVVGPDGVTQGGPTEYFITPAQITAVPTHPAQNMLVATEPGNIQLFRLTNGDLQLVAPSIIGSALPNYTFEWAGCI